MDLVKVVVEILGTFFFLSVILQTLTDASIGPIAVAIIEKVSTAVENLVEPIE